MSENNLSNKIDEKLPLSRSITLGFQHALALYAGAIAVPLVIAGSLGLSPSQTAMLISAGVFTSGIATLVHNIGIGRYLGVRLPVMMGCAFAVVGAAVAIGKASGINVMFGSIIAMGIIMMLAAPIVGQLTKYFPHLVTGSIVTIIGITLLPSAFKSIGGGNLNSPSFGDPVNLLLALIVIVVILISNRFLKGYMQTISVLLGLFAGTVVAGFMGMLNFSQVASAKWIEIIMPFSFGAPKFEFAGILTLGILGVVELTESVGVFSGVADICKTKLSKKQLIAGLAGEGFANLLGGIFNAFPFITYSQNIGLLSLTKVVSRYATIAGGVILIILGCMPKVAALATVIPNSVFGGAMLVMFSMVSIAGINMLRDVDLSDAGNMLTASLSIGLGVGATLVPTVFQHCPTVISTIFHSGIVTGAIVAIICNLIFNGDGTKKNMITESEQTA